MKGASLLLCLLLSSAVSAEPCASLEREVSGSDRKAFAVAIEHHLKAGFSASAAAIAYVRAEDVLIVLQLGSWFIVKASTHASDDVYLFYGSRPDRAENYKAIWGGAAAVHERPEIEAWAVEHAPGIPHELARCFATLAIYGELK
jgi:hypothetical protein